MEPSPGIVQAFGPPPEGVDITETSVPQNDAAVVVLAALACLAVALRLYARFLQGHGLHADDWTIILSLVTFPGLPLSIDVVVGCEND